MKALLILAHGSRKAESNQEVQNLADTYAILNGDDYPIVKAGFLELSQPDIDTVITESVQAGATELTILPYFLAAGAHVVDDIPSNVTKSINKFSDIEVHILPHIGAAGGMIGLIKDVALSPVTEQ